MDTIPLKILPQKSSKRFSYKSPERKLGDTEEHCFSIEGSFYQTRVRPLSNPCHSLPMEQVSVNSFDDVWEISGLLSFFLIVIGQDGRSSALKMEMDKILPKKSSKRFPNKHQL